MLHESSWARETIGLGSNTDSGSKMRVYCYRDTAILYLAFIIRNLFLNYFCCNIQNILDIYLKIVL